MKTILLLFGLTAIALHSSAAEFTRSTTFDSVVAFVDAAKSFQPETHKSDLSALFTVRELGQPEDPKTGSLVAAKAIYSSVKLWANESHALIFVTAAPPTDATRSFVGSLFLLAHESGSWRIADVMRFFAAGKYAGVSAELTADAYRSDAMSPVITIKESHGGRGYAYQVSASFTFSSSKLKRLELE